MFDEPDKTPHPQLAEYLFPNSPMEIEEENGETHIYMEGQWYSKLTDKQRFPEEAVQEDMREEYPHDDFKGGKRFGKMFRGDVLYLELRRLAVRHGDDWLHKSTRIAPDWPKWSQVEAAKVTENFNDEVERLSSGKTKGKQSGAGVKSPPGRAKAKG